MMTKNGLWAALLLSCSMSMSAQVLTLPYSGTNPKCMAGRRVGLTDIEVQWNAPSVRGREGAIWGTSIAHFGYEVLGFGSDMPSPWRAGADECTRISFSTDVSINGKSLPAGEYALFMALSADSSTLIFSKNRGAWGSYFYDKSMDVLYVSVRQEKGRGQSVEQLAYTFSGQTEHSVEVAMEWERWRIPFTVGVDLKVTGLASLRHQMSGALGFDPPAMVQAAQWCLQQEMNYEQALHWINTATDPNFGGLKTFSALSTKAELLKKLGRNNEADDCMKLAMETANALELHGYGRSLIVEKKYAEALAVFKKNYEKHNGAWPTNVGLARGYSAVGDLKKALEHARKAMEQAPDDVNKRSLEAIIKQLGEGKPLNQ